MRTVGQVFVAVIKNGTPPTDQSRAVVANTPREVALLEQSRQGRRTAGVDPYLMRVAAARRQALLIDVFRSRQGGPERRPDTRCTAMPVRLVGGDLYGKRTTPAATGASDHEYSGVADTLAKR